MTAEEARESDFITRARAAARKIWDGENELELLQNEYNAQDYGTTLNTGTGENEGITKTQVGAAVFATADAVRTLFNTGHATNLTDLL